MSSDIIAPVSAIVGGGFFGGILLGYALKKVFKLIAVIGGLFVAGLTYLQYQQIAAFDWNRIEVLASAALGNVAAQITNSQESIAFSMSNYGIPLTGIQGSSSSATSFALDSSEGSFFSSSCILNTLISVLSFYYVGPTKKH